MSQFDLTDETKRELEALSDSWTLAPVDWRPSEAFVALERIGFADRVAPRARWHYRRTPHGRAFLGLPKL